MQVHTENNNKFNNSLLTKAEFQYLANNKNESNHHDISKNFEYKMRSTIRKKVKIFLENELPLLVQNDFLRYNDFKNISNLRETRININENEKVDLVRKRSRVQKCGNMLEFPPKAMFSVDKIRLSLVEYKE